MDALRYIVAFPTSYPTLGKPVESQMTTYSLKIKNCIRGA